MKDYAGSLAPYKALIAAMLLAGQSYRQTAKLLYAVGARPAYGSRDFCKTWEENMVGPMTAMISHLNKRWEGRYRTPGQRKRDQWNDPPSRWETICNSLDKPAFAAR